MSETNKSNKAMTCREAGHRGGEKRKKELGPEGYSKIGKMGGQTTKERHGPGYYGKIGRLGGEALLEKYGPEHFSNIGRIGGQRVRQLIEQGKRSEPEPE